LVSLKPSPLTLECGHAFDTYESPRPIAKAPLYDLIVGKHLVTHVKHLVRDIIGALLHFLLPPTHSAPRTKKEWGAAKT
jgi:hypothetical protein